MCSTLRRGENSFEEIYQSEDSHSLKTTDPPQENSISEDNGSLAETVLLEENGDGVPKKECKSPWEESGQQSNEQPVYPSSVTKKEGNQVYVQVGGIFVVVFLLQRLK